MYRMIVAGKLLNKFPADKVESMVNNCIKQARVEVVGMKSDKDSVTIEVKYGNDDRGAVSRLNQALDPVYRKFGIVSDVIKEDGDVHTIKFHK